jgi:hypothetical protein
MSENLFYFEKNSLSGLLGLSLPEFFCPIQCLLHRATNICIRQNTSIQLKNMELTYLSNAYMLLAKAPANYLGNLKGKY